MGRQWEARYPDCCCEIRIESRGASEEPAMLGHGKVACLPHTSLPPRICVCMGSPLSRYLALCVLVLFVQGLPSQPGQDSF